MPVYTYRGTNQAGRDRPGERTAGNKTEVTATLRREQINVSKLSEKGKEFNIPSFGERRGLQGTGRLHPPVLGDD